MHKKSKTILTAVLTALFVLSVSYFALLAPTTAWYYQEEDKNYSFEFGNFDMSFDENNLPQSIADITFRGATRFADAGEELFDEMLHIIQVTATNNGDSNGSVRISVKQNGSDLPVNNAQGLRWFVYEPDANSTVKDKIDDMLTAWNPDWPIDYNTLTSNESVDFTEYNQVDGEAESAYDLYNGTTASGGDTYSGGATDALVEYNKRGVTVPAGETKDVNIAFWVEYSAVKTPFGVGSSASARDTSIPSLTFSNLAIQINAMPDIGGTDTTTLRINNNASGAVSVKLYQYTSDWVLFTDAPSITDNNGEIAVSAGGYKEIPDLSVGSRYKVVIQGSAAVHFDDSADGQDATADGKTITATLSNGTNTIAIDANASS